MTWIQKKFKWLMGIICIVFFSFVFVMAHLDSEERKFATRPMPENDYVKLVMNTSISHNILSNDTITIYRNILFFEIEEAPMHGTVTLQKDGTMTYVPDSDFVGEDTFSYTLGNRYGRDIGNVYITVKESNIGPIAVDDRAIEASSIVPIHISFNDVDVDDEKFNLEYTITKAPDMGRAYLYKDQDGEVYMTYYPYPHAYGMDTITYQVSDGIDYDEATVSIILKDLPIVEEDRYQVELNQPITMDPLENDYCPNDCSSYSLLVYEAYAWVNGRTHITTEIDDFFTYEVISNQISFIASQVGQYEMRYYLRNDALDASRSWAVIYIDVIEPDEPDIEEVKFTTFDIMEVIFLLVIIGFIYSNQKTTMIHKHIK